MMDVQTPSDHERVESQPFSLGLHQGFALFFPKQPLERVRGQIVNET